MPLSKRGRRGVFGLLIIAGVAAILPRLVIFLFNEGSQKIEVNHEEFAVLAEELLSEDDDQNNRWNKNTGNKFKIPPMRFDPNQYSKEDWMHLGVSEKQADVILKFSERGLYSNDDLKRIFVLPVELFELIKDSTFYPVREVIAFNKITPEREKIWVDINKANKEELIKIPGIGDYYADKIVFYREKLGGFVNANQLLEIRKFDAQKLEDIGTFIHLGSGEVRMLDVNTADFESLNAHPYISYDVANSIVKMRAQKPFQKLSDIKRSMLIDDELFEKLRPYITIR